MKERTRKKQRSFRAWLSRKFHTWQKGRHDRFTLAADRFLHPWKHVMKLSMNSIYGKMGHTRVHWGGTFTMDEP